MNAHNRGVNHLYSCIMSSSERLNDPTPNTCPAPANEAIVASGVGAEALREVAPRRSRSQDPKDAIQDTAVVYTRDTPWLVRSIGRMVAHSWSVSS
jgi:hypothetical protein